MYADCLDTSTPRPFARLTPFEAGWLLCAGGFAVAAFVVLLLPHDAVAWAIAHFG